jgi:hypothetical protein
MPSKILLYFCDGQVRHKITVDNKCLQVNDVIYLGWEISLKMRKVFNKKKKKRCSNAGKYKQHFKNTFDLEVFKIKPYNALALPVSSYWRKIWTLTRKDEQDRKYTCNVTLTQVSATIVAVEKQWVLHIVTVCL